MLRKFLVLVFLPMLVCVPASAQTIDEIIAKNIEARGGAEKIKSIQTIRLSGKMLVQGAETPILLQMKRPDSVRMEFQLQGATMIQAYDGKTAWMIAPSQDSKDPELMDEEQTKDMKEQADFDGPLFDYKTKGHAVELVGREDMNGKAVYNLKLTMKSGSVRNFYLDAENYLELKAVSKFTQYGVEYEMVNYFGDYKTVDGLMMAHSFEGKVRDKTVSQMTIEKVELNVALNDALFKMPRTTKETPSAKTK